MAGGRVLGAESVMVLSWVSWEEGEREWRASFGISGGEGFLDQKAK